MESNYLNTYQNLASLSPLWSTDQISAYLNPMQKCLDLIESLLMIEQQLVDMPWCIVHKTQRKGVKTWQKPY